MPNESNISLYPLTIGLVISTASLWDAVQAELRGLPVRVVMETPGVEDIVTLIEKVSRSKPDVILLDPSTAESHLGELIGQLKSTIAKPYVVVIRETASPELILSAIRAGASEYLYPPLTSSLREMLERVSAERRQKNGTADSQTGKVVGFLSVKGGCGATTIACHSALEVAELTDKPTLLADMDFAAGLVGVLMKTQSRYSIFDAMSNVQRLDPSYWRGLVSNGFKGLEIISATQSELPRRAATPHEVKHVLRFMRGNYGWVLLDLGHGLEAPTLSAVEDVDILMLISTLEIPALQQAKHILHQLQSAGIPREKVRLVLNRIPRKAELGPEDVEGALATPIYATIPNDYGSLERAYSEGKLLDEGNQVRQAIRRLSGRFAEVQTEAKRRKLGFLGL